MSRSYGKTSYNEEEIDSIIKTRDMWEWLRDNFLYDCPESDPDDPRDHSGGEHKNCWPFAKIASDHTGCLLCVDYGGDIEDMPSCWGCPLSNIKLSELDNVGPDRYDCVDSPKSIIGYFEWEDPDVDNSTKKELYEFADWIVNRCNVILKRVGA